MKEKTINIAKDFSECPSGRYRTDGPASGEAFREDILWPALQNFDVVIVTLDGTEGYGSSFLEEAFGGAIRKKYVSKQDIDARLIIKADGDAYKHYQKAVYKYLDKAIYQVV